MTASMAAGTVTLRYQSKFRHLGARRRYAGIRVMPVVADRDGRIISPKTACS